LRVLRAIIDGPYTGWKPTPQDWYRIGFGRVICVDKDGLVSPMETNSGAYPKFGVNEGYKDHPSLTSESRGETHPMGGSMGNDDHEALQHMFAMGRPTGYGAIRPGDLPPADFFTGAPSFSDSPATFTSSESDEPSSSDTNRVDRINGGTNGARIAGDFSPILPMGLMIYNDLMTDIEGTARVLGQEFRESVLFGSTPTSFPTPAVQPPDQGPEPQPPSTMYGWVPSSVQLTSCKC